MNRLLCGAVAILLAGTVSLSAQGRLPIGTSGSGTASSEQPARFDFTPSGPGVLTIVVHAMDDVTIRVTDSDGQPLPEATVDRDYNGQLGLEFLAVPVSDEDPLRVEVTAYDDSEGGSFTITASFIASEAFRKAADPDRRPSLAKPLAVGAASEESLDPDGGDGWDWFRITADQAMTVAIVTRMSEGNEGDLTLAVHAENAYDTALADSDQDLQGHTGNESVSVDLKAGQSVYVKVAALFGGGPTGSRWGECRDGKERSDRHPGRVPRSGAQDDGPCSLSPSLPFSPTLLLPFRPGARAGDVVQHPLRHRPGWCACLAQSARVPDCGDP
ncbi:MAG TPA: hypothetical protein PLL69_02175 [Gemmatimonadales bacterium]|nr:hypothetical protein [Gemmatimonadales bacterium]